MIKLVWDSPKLHKYGGLYLRWDNKRYRVFKWGEF
jgi:hypothetical protein